MNNLFKNNEETTLLDRLVLPKLQLMRLIAKKSSKKKEKGSTSIIWVISLANFAYLSKPKTFTTSIYLKNENRKR